MTSDCETELPNRVNTSDRLIALREEMKNHQIDAYYVPLDDLGRRTWISGFSGSNGDAIVTKVTEELISPTELSQIHGVSISAIRKWVKDAGKNLPYRYKSSKLVTPPKSILMSSISDSAVNNKTKTASAAIENDQTPHLHNIADESEKPNEGSMFGF